MIMYEIKSKFKIFAGPSSLREASARPSARARILMTLNLTLLVVSTSWI